MLERNKKITKNQTFVWEPTEGFNPDAQNNPWKIENLQKCNENQKITKLL
jgi:hypothetical protein